MYVEAVSGATAVVAEHHELERAALAGILLRDFGFRRVIEAGSLDEALGHLARIPDVAFASFDLAMPGMNGAASLKGVRDDYPNVRLAVITDSERREDILLALEAGVHGYIPKGLRIVEILDAIQTMLDGRLFVPAALANKALRDANGGHAAEIESRLRVTLPPRQAAVLRLMSVGKTNKEIARDLNLAEGTIKVHVNALYRALGAHNRTSAVAAMTALTANGTRR